MKKLVNERNAWRAGYGHVIKGIATRGVCPFCSEYLHSYHKKPLVERKYWWVTENMYPYHPVRHHLLFIHKTHCEYITELSQSAWEELREIIAENIREKKIEGGAFVFRFGDTHFTGASVAHLHAHLVQSDPEHTDYTKEKKIPEGVIARIG